MRKLLLIFSIALIFSACNKGGGGGQGGATGIGGSSARFTVVGNYLYAVDRESIRVFDITDPAQPKFKRTVPVGFGIETIFPFKDKLFLGSTSVVYIFDITDPSNPRKQGEAISQTVMRRCDPVVARDNAAYATLRTNGPCGGVMSTLAVFDITDVQHPVQVNALPLGSPYGLGYEDHTLYVCDQQQGLLVFDIRSPYQPVLVKTVPLAGVDPLDVIAQGDVLVVWTSQGIHLYNIAERNNPVLLTQLN